MTKVRMMSRPFALPAEQIHFERSVPSDLALIPPLLVRAVESCEGRGMFREAYEEHHFTTCVEEALRNAIVHGNGSDFHRKVCLQVFANAAEFGVVVRDEGAGFSLQKIPRGPEDGVSFSAAGGMGIHIMTHYMDRVEFFEGGCVLVLARNRGPRDALAELSQDGMLSVVAEGDGIVVRFLQGKLRDSRRVHDILEKLNQFVETRAQVSLVLDLSSVDYLSSCSIGYILRLYKRVREGGGALKISGVRQSVLETFRIMQLTKVLDIHSAVEPPLEGRPASTSR
jgi:anti-anti-sigma factor